MRSSRASTSRISRPPKRLLKRQRRPRRPSPRARLPRQHRRGLRHLHRPRASRQWVRLPLPLQDPPPRRLLDLPPLRRLLPLEPFVPVVFRRRVRQLLPALHLPRLRLPRGLAPFRLLQVRDPACRCVQRRPAQLRPALRMQLPDSRALLPHNVQPPQLRRRPRGQPPPRPGLRVRRQAAKDFRRRVRRGNPARAIKGRGPVRRRACVPRQLQAEHHGQAVRRDRAVLRVPVAPREDFLNDRAAQAAVPGKRRSAASAPAQPPAACLKRSPASHCMRASHLLRAGVR